jgi:hypothetical protein
MTERRLIKMKPLYILMLVCLILTTCDGVTVTSTPDNNATVMAGVMRTLTAQPAAPTQAATPTQGNNSTSIVQSLTAIAKTQIAQTPQINIETAVARTLTAMATASLRPSPTLALATPTTAQTLKSTPTLTIPPAATSSTPKIIFTSVPAINTSGLLYGKIEGVNPDKVVVAVYIRVGAGWWTKPYWDAPLTYISSNGTWSCEINTGVNDGLATAIRAYLIPAGYNPPSMSGGSTLPSDLERNAVAKAEATR